MSRLSPRQFYALPSLLAIIIVVGGLRLAYRRDQPAPQPLTALPSPLTTLSTPEGKQQHSLGSASSNEIVLPSAFAAKGTSAVIQTGRSTETLTPNEVGLYPRVVVGPNQTIPIAVKFLSPRAGEVIAISADDGGALVGDIPVQTVILAADGIARLQFTTSADSGLFRVILRRGTERQQLNFWVGPELPLQTHSAL